MTDVLIAGGGTGGHLFPGIALAQEVKRRDPSSRILFVGTARGIEVRAVPKAGFDLALLKVSGLKRTGVVGLVAGLFRLPLALVNAIGVVHRFKPQVAVSVGGYAAGPAVLAARILGVPCVVMEQNAVPGLTNRILAKVATKVVASMPATALQGDKILVLGNPVRSDLLPVRDSAYAPQSPLRLFIFGGSQGARAVNEAFMKIASRLKDLGVTIRHQTGEADVARVKGAYEEVGFTGVNVSAFIDDMATAYKDADLIICRAGATSIAELTVCGRPSILVPFPGATDDHQTANAKALEITGAAIHIAQGADLADRLWDVIAALTAERLITMAKAARETGRPLAASAIADTLDGVRRV
ncbi:MAG: undecaprenyldiphospho-muramoylpentapeptide beta-N-acetylglucosaminyltransferase [Clostridia bacterium]|nr:undecaprenyldiphospho-muramoylpentapeptide beta-N-acetylglucosaminyltransferase [Deltaproteobacteria bacterium]